VDYKKIIEFYKVVLGFKVGHFWSFPEFQITEASMQVSPDGRTCLEIFDNDAVIADQGKKAETADEIRHGALLRSRLSDNKHKRHILWRKYKKMIQIDNKYINGRKKR